MQITLAKPEFENFIRDQVNGGQYPSPAAVVEAALSQFMSQEFAPGELARMVAEADASIAKHGLRDVDEVFGELKERSKLARIRAKK
jgi:Arc/MetJ-type ribon-helix-helix transcriptional regulator